jgi:hypothetical protein
MRIAVLRTGSEPAAATTAAMTTVSRATLHAAGWTSVLMSVAFCLVGAPPASAALLCPRGSATGSMVGRPTDEVAWRAALLGPTGVHGGVTCAGTRARTFVGPAQTSWLLVLDAARTCSGRCWVDVRLPWRPNNASGWVDASRVILRTNAWRIVVSTPERRREPARSAWEAAATAASGSITRRSTGSSARSAAGRCREFPCRWSDSRPRRAPGAPPGAGAARVTAARRRVSTPWVVEHARLRLLSAGR